MYVCECSCHILVWELNTLSCDFLPLDCKWCLCMRVCVCGANVSGLACPHIIRHLVVCMCMCPRAYAWADKFLLLCRCISVSIIMRDCILLLACAVVHVTARAGVGCKGMRAYRAPLSLCVTTRQHLRLCLGPTGVWWLSWCLSGDNSQFTPTLWRMEGGKGGRW